MKTRLTKEQSNHLRSLGCKFPNNVAIQDYNGDFYVLIELHDLLEILPKEIKWKYGKTPIVMTFGSDTNPDPDVWFAFYDDIVETNGMPSKELIDALYQLACWYYGEYLKREER